MSQLGAELGDSSASDKDVRIFRTPSRSYAKEALKYDSLGHYLLSKLNNSPDPNRPLITDFETGKTLNATQLYVKIMNLATALVDKYNFKPNTAVSIYYDNSSETAILALGIICAGGIVACSYPKDPYAELLYLAKKVGPKFLFCHGKNVAKWSEQLSQDLGYKIVAISMDNNNQAPTDHDNINNLLNYDFRGSSATIPVKVDDLKTQVAIIVMSSGTTGKPKAVSTTHWNCLLDLLDASFTQVDIDFSKVSFACCSGLDYASGRIILFGALNSGYNTIIMNGFDPDSYARAIEKYRINTLYVGAASFYNFITNPNLDKYDLSSVYMIYPVGAKVTYLKELEEFLEKYPNIKRVRQAYGGSELGGVAINALTPSEYLRDSENCGRLLPGVEAKVVDQFDGKLLGKNQEGIFHIKTEGLFPGYYDINLKSSSPFYSDETIFDEDGFYITGDLGYFNDKEELYCIGRCKELMCCRAAKKVYPHELEELVNKHPAVDRVCVLGVRSKVSVLVDCPRAFVVPKKEYLDNPELIDNLKEVRNEEGVLTDELAGENESCPLKHSGNADTKISSLPRELRRKLAEDIMQFSNDRIGWEKQMTGGIVILDDIPTSRATGKMDKNYLRSLTVDQFEIYGDQSS